MADRGSKRASADNIVGGLFRAGPPQKGVGPDNGSVISGNWLRSWLESFVELFNEQVTTRTRTFDGCGWTADTKSSSGTSARVCLEGKSGHAAARGLGPAAERFAIDAALNKAKVGRPGQFRLAGLPSTSPSVERFSDAATSAYLEQLRERLAALRPDARVCLQYHDVSQHIHVERASKDCFLVSDSRRRWGISVEIYPGDDVVFERSGGGNPNLTQQACDQLCETVASAFPFYDLPIDEVCDGDHVVCFSPAAAAMIFHEAVGHPLEHSEGLHRPILQVGQQLGPSWLTVEDRPDIEGLFATQTRDDCGFGSARVPLIRQGVLVGLLAGKDGCASNVAPSACFRRQDYRYPPRSRMSNLVVAPGPASSADLIAQSNASIYVGKVSEGFIDNDTNVFTVAVLEAWSLDHGRYAARLRPFALECPVSHFMGRMLGSGSDQQTLSMYCVSDDAVLPVSSSASTLVCGPLHVSRARELPVVQLPERFDGII